MTRERKLELTRKIGLFGLSDLRKLAPIGDLGYANGWYEPSGDGSWMNGGMERQAMLGAIVEYCMMMERKQQLRLVVRESYYRVAYHVFNYLRRNRQLARREGAFDKDVKLVLTCTLSRLLVEYGTDKD